MPSRYPDAVHRPTWPDSMSSSLGSLSSTERKPVWVRQRRDVLRSEALSSSRISLKDRRSTVPGFSACARRFW